MSKATRTTTRRSNGSSAPRQQPWRPTTRSSTRSNAPSGPRWPTSSKLTRARPGGTPNVPEEVKREVAKRRKKETEAGVTRRSDDPIDFTTFGELSEIIKSNWDLFGAIFSDIKAVQSVMSRLNTLRGPVAHCVPLAEDEVLRLRLSVRDWFRLME
jgi:hypothetical protein